MKHKIGQKIEESCKRFRKENGNSNFSDNDLLIHVLTKIDSVEEKIASQVTFCKTHLAEKKSVVGYAFQILTFLIAIAAIVVATG